MTTGRREYISWVLLPLFLLSGSGLHAQQERPFRIGVQVGVTAGQNRYTWLSSGEQRSTMDEEVRQNGYAGFILEYHVAPKLVLEFSPHHGQRNTPISTMQRLGGVNYALSQDPVEYLGIPMLGKYFPIATGLLRPYAGVGVEFGMNLTALTMMIEEHRISDEPVRKSTIRRRRNLNQLYSALLAEAGLDISASSRVAVLLGVRYTMELTPLLRDDLLTWEAPDVWRIRFALLFRFGGGQ